MKITIISLLVLTLLLVNACTKQEQIIPLIREEEPTQEEVTPECIIDDDCDQGICEDGTTYKRYACSSSKCISISYVRDPCQKIIPQQPEPPEQFYAYFIGDEFKVGDKTVIVKNIQQDGEITLLNNRQDITIKGTGNFAKIDDYEITLSKLNLETDPQKRSVILTIEEIKLNENEYLLDYGEEVRVKGKTVKLKDIHTDELNTISVRVSEKLNAMTERINGGKTKQILGLNITNIRTNPRPTSYEKYAIVRIE